LAGVLKQSLRQLSDSVIPFQYYSEFIKFGNESSDEKKAAVFPDLISKLPSSNKACLFYLMNFLNQLSTFHEITKMTPKNLAIVFGPNLVRPAVESMETAMDSRAVLACCEYMIQNSDKIWAAEDRAHNVIAPECKITMKSKDSRLKFGRASGGHAGDAAAPAMKGEHKRTLKVMVEEAKDLIPMDPGGTSDPYVVVVVGDQQRKTKKIMKTLNPAWKEAFVFEFSSQAIPNKCLFQVMDWDMFSADDFLGSCEVDLWALRELDIFSGWLPLEGVKTGSVKVSMTFN